MGPADLIALGDAPGVGPRTVKAVVEGFPTLEALRDAPEARIRAALGPRAANAILAAVAEGMERRLALARITVERHLEHGIAVIPLTSTRYPSLLRLTPDPPAVLYVRGDLDAVLGSVPVAVVGTRHPTPRGVEVARRLGRWFASSGLVVVSGLAIGIDTAAHRGALEVGRTVAVLGTSIDEVHPRANRELADAIVETGALVSEYRMGAAVPRGSFVARDRIQAGLSAAVVPVQTSMDGGTMHSVRNAIAYGRVVLAPIPQADPRAIDHYEGVNHLIAEGTAEKFDGTGYGSVLDRVRGSYARALDAVRQTADGAEERTLGL